MPLMAALSRSACAMDFLLGASCLVRANVSSADDFAPAVELALDQRRIAFGAQSAGPHADLGKSLLHLRALQRRADLGLPALGDLGRNAGRGRKAEPVGRHHGRKSRFAESR